MNNKQRYKKLRLLVKKVNKERKKQAKKIDILCNDFIAAQRNFIKKLNTISFTADFCKSIVGIAEMNNLLYTAGKFIKNEIDDANISFFLRQTDSFELHLSESNQPITLEEHRFENCFTNELVENICKSNKLCTLDNLLAMGLQGNPTVLGKISAVTIPLGRLGSSAGFILLYRSSENKLTDEELNNISAITPVFSRAIAACQVLSRSAD